MKFNFEKYKVKFRKLSSLSRMPKFILRMLYNIDDWIIGINLSANLNTPPDILHKLALKGGSTERIRIARNPNILLETFKDLATDGFPDVTIALARNPNIPEYILKRIAKCSNCCRVEDAVITKIAILDNKKCSAEIIDSFINEENMTIKIKIAEHQNSSVKALRTLAENPNENIYSLLAINPNTPSDVLYKIFEFDYKTEQMRDVVWGRIAKHPNCPDDVLISLAKNARMAIKSMMIERNDLPLEVFDILSDDGDVAVRISLSRCENLPVYIALKLTKDNDLVVRYETLRRTKHLSVIEKFFHYDGFSLKNSPTLRKAIAFNKNTSKEILDELSCYPEVREEMLKNPNTRILTKFKLWLGL